MDDLWEFLDDPLDFSWVKWRRVATLRVAELGDPNGYVGPTFQAGVAWYDRPDGTTDHEGGNP
jgi:hypothetical protein